MIYVKWAAMLPVSILVTVLGIVLSPILPLFAKDGWLPKWLSWFQTPDNSLYGDDGWKTEHWMWRYKLPTKICTYVGEFGWLLRNPGQGYGVVYLSGDPIVATFTGNDQVNDSPGVEGTCTVHCQNLFQWVWVKKIGSDECIYCNFGWNIKGCINGDERTHIATYTFSPRIAAWK